MSQRGLIIFDLDGTLFETDGATVPAVECVFERFGLACPSADEIRSFIGKPELDFHAWLNERSSAGDAGELLAAHDIGRFFDRVRCRVSSRDTKPRMVQGLLARMTARPAIVVGDRREDVDAGLENGLATIAADYGYGSPEELERATARAASVAEVPTIVRQLVHGHDTRCLTHAP